MNKMTVIATMTVAIVAFQNFDYVSLFHVPLQQVNHQVRAEHAKELLGKKYKGSSAQKAENMPDLNYAIFSTVYKNLPKKYRHQAGLITETIIEQAHKYDFDPVFALAVIKTESSFNPKALGSAGEIGLMQLKPDTAEWIAKKYGLKYRNRMTLENPADNIRLGMAYFHNLRSSFDGYANKYVNAYNMGATKVRRLYASSYKPNEYSGRVIKNYTVIYEKLVATRLPVIAHNL